MKVHIEGLGRRDVIIDVEQIKWFFESVCNTKTCKAHQTKFWLDLHERYGEFLKKNEAYDLLAFIIDKATKAKIEKRAKYRLEKQAESQLMEAKWFEWKENNDRKQQILKNLNYN